MVLLIPVEQNSNCLHQQYKVWSCSCFFYDAPQGSVLGPVLFVLYTTPLSEVIEHHSIRHHLLADDTQLRKSAPPHHASELVQSMQECIHDVKVWMSSHKLKLNDDKTKAMIVSSQRMSTPLPMPDSLAIGISNVIYQNSRCDTRYTFDHGQKKKNRL